MLAPQPPCISSSVVSRHSSNKKSSLQCFTRTRPNTFTPTAWTNNSRAVERSLHTHARAHTNMSAHIQTKARNDLVCARAEEEEVRSRALPKLGGEGSKLCGDSCYVAHGGHRAGIVLTADNAYRAKDGSGGDTFIAIHVQGARSPVNASPGPAGSRANGTIKQHSGIVGPGGWLLLCRTGARSRRTAIVLL